MWRSNMASEMSSRPKSDENIRLALKKHFGYDSFKSEMQEQAVKAIYQGQQDVFVSMPTGSGKSLCYQLPAVLNDGKVTIVFSPLLALMKDQIDHMHKLHINAGTINSKLTAAERACILHDLKSKKPSTSLLYVTPEQAHTETFKDIITRLHKHDKLANLVVDEAHCVSQWGHDFRPHYLKLGKLKKLCPGTQWVALTATATKSVVEDILKQLSLRKPVATFKVPCFRSNLFYDVVFSDTMADPCEDLKDFIEESLDCDNTNTKRNNRGCGIVYCRTREQTEELAEDLRRKGIGAHAYHAGLRDAERGKVQEEWMSGKYAVITATVSFGMGVDKSTVRFVAHWGLPQSVAGYYQESGRAGRDGKPARCRIYFSRQERSSVTWLLQRSLGKAKSQNKKEQASAAMKTFERMLKYCDDTTCRHAVFAEYFGDEPPQCIDQCDCCVNSKAVENSVAQFYEVTSKKTFIQPASKFGDDANLYGGGRAGQQKEAEDYMATGEQRELEAKRVSEKLIQRQFKMRKGSTQHVITRDGKTEEDDVDLSTARVKAAASTASKVNGLTVAVRNTYLGLIEDVMKANWSRCHIIDPPDRELSEDDIVQTARNVEYQVFSKNTVASLYRRTLMKQMSDIKKNTERLNLDPQLREWQPEQSSPTAQLPLIKTASQVLAEQLAAKSAPPSKVQTNTVCKVPKTSIFAKKDPLQQTSIKSFFCNQGNDLKDCVKDCEESSLNSTELNNGEINILSCDSLPTDSCVSFRPASSLQSASAMISSESKVPLKPASNALNSSSSKSDSVFLHPANVSSSKCSKIKSPPAKHRECAANAAKVADEEGKTVTKRSHSEIKVELKRQGSSASSPTSGRSHSKTHENNKLHSEKVDLKPRDSIAPSPTSGRSHSKTRENNKLHSEKVDLKPRDSSAPSPTSGKSRNKTRENNKLHREKVDLKPRDRSAPSPTSGRSHSKTHENERSRGEKVHIKSSSSLASSPEAKKRRVSSPSEKEMKAQVANRVVAHLMPHYKEGKIISRPLFKVIAKHLSDTMIGVKTDKDDATIKAHVDRFMTQKSVFSTEKDVFS